MGVNKLNIEFEEEEEVKTDSGGQDSTPKAEEVVELEFDLGSGVDSPSSSEAAKPAEATVQEAAPSSQTPSEGLSLDSGTAEFELETHHVDSASPASTNTASTEKTNSGIQIVSHESSGTSEYEFGDELKSLAKNNRALCAEIQAQIKIQVMEKTMEIKMEQAQSSKLLEYKVNKMISQIAAKAPNAKKELLMIKKLLSENAEVKKRPVSKAPQTKIKSIKKKAA